MHIRGRWRAPDCYVLEDRVGSELYTFIPRDRPDIIRIAVIGGGGNGHVSLTREQARALVDAINELGDRMVGLA